MKFLLALVTVLVTAQAHHRVLYRYNYRPVLQQVVRAVHITPAVHLTPYCVYGRPAVVEIVKHAASCYGIAEGYLPDEACDRFQQCSNGDSYLMSCPPGLWWSQSLARCIYPRRSECAKSVVLVTAAPVPRETVAIETVKVITHSASCFGIHGGYLPDANCNVFHHCSHGDDNVKWCPAGLWWSQAHLTCLQPSQSECGKTLQYSRAIIAATPLLKYGYVVRH